MKKELKPYVTLCDAIAKLFYPNVEVVMHDLEAKKLVHIVNAFSKRRVGDAMISELKDLGSIKENWVGPYDKTSSDGKRLKAVSIIVRNSYLHLINPYLSVFLSSLLSNLTINLSI
ncbi:PAS domain-containing protein [Sulfurospirillum cavolei]|uniref:PAS domain-containing protein n=1 Tax=Sulfurospirillum cavolei TaxID=366522 RepID=UPI003FA1ECDE